MNRALTTALVVLILASVSALSLFASDSPAPQLGHAPPTHAVGFEPYDNVPSHPVGVRVVARSAKTARPVVVHVPPVGVLQDLIRAGFARFGPVVAEEAVRQAGCESTGDSSGERIDPNATGSEGEVGMFQIHPRYHTARAARFGYSMNDLYDPAANIVVAVDLYAEQGWSPWSCRP